MAKIHVVSYTHWDREFRFDFETTHSWLIRLMDNLLEILRAKPEFQHYTIDGQVGLVDDYLEARPEKEDEIRRLTADGRLMLGPWYSLPDSSSIHGESLVRNLMTGLRRSRELGGAMEVGYNVFSFGQIAQLPQVYAGFGIDFIFFYKHMDRRRSRYDEFHWEAPDGTTAFASRLGSQARWNFFFAGQVPIVYDKDPFHKDWRYVWGELGKTFHFCEPDTFSTFHFVTDPETTFHPKNVKAGFDRTLETVKGTAVPEHLLFFDGTDFTEPHPMIPEIIAAANQAYAGEHEVVHSTLPQYAAALRPLLAKLPIDRVRGEMKDGPIGAIHTDVCSLHAEIKRANGQAENALFRAAEPFAAAAWLRGADYPGHRVAKATRLLFHSQAHDSLHGVGPAPMVADIQSRLLQARVIADAVTETSLHALAAQIDTASVRDGKVFVTVFNPAAFARTEVVEALVEVPREIPVDQLTLQDDQGREIPSHVLAVEETKAGLYHPRSRNMPFYVTRFRVVFEAADVPALGYKTFVARWTERSLYPYPHEDWDQLRVPYESVATGPRSAENEQIKLTIADDGTLEIFHKETGRTFRGLNSFLDNGEGGNLYFHRPPSFDRTISSAGLPAEISRTLSSPLMARFEVRTVLRVPAQYEKSAQRRSAAEVELPIVSTITVRRGTARVDIETTVDNRAKDHFLRACFPTGIAAERTVAGGVFDVNTYPTAVSRDGQYRGQDLPRRQQHLFMDLSDAKGGLAILNDTLRDYEVLDAARGVIAHSLLRGSPLRIPVDNRLWMEYPGDESAQSLGLHTIRYSLLPHAGDWTGAELPRHAVANAAPMRVAQIGPQKGTLPTTHGFLTLGGRNLVLSAVKKAQDRDSLIVRFFNPTDQAVEAELSFGEPLAEAYSVSLNEDHRQALKIDGGKIRLSAGPKKILSIECVPARTAK